MVYPRIIAHRGGGGLAPENSLAGLTAAANTGCRGVEFDTMLSADGVPVLMHDCTGPFTLLAGIHVAISNVNVAWQETVRAHLQMRYPELIDTPIEIHSGRIHAPARSGLGAKWQERWFEPGVGEVRVSQAS